jgi:hypothetical protein
VYISFAAQTLRRFVNEAIDSPRRFLEKRPVVLQRFTPDLAQESGRPVEQLPVDAEGTPVVCPTAVPYAFFMLFLLLLLLLLLLLSTFTI